MLFPHKQPYDNQEGAVLEKVIVALKACTKLVQVCAIVLRYVPYKITGTNNIDPSTISVSSVVDDIIVWSSLDSVSNVVVGNVVINITVTSPKHYPIITVPKSNNPLDPTAIAAKTNPSAKVSNRYVIGIHLQAPIRGIRAIVV